jgi:hypothetical protein
MLSNENMFFRFLTSFRFSESWCFFIHLSPLIVPVVINFHLIFQKIRKLFNLVDRLNLFVCFWMKKNSKIHCRYNLEYLASIIKLRIDLQIYSSHQCKIIKFRLYSKNFTFIIFKRDQKIVITKFMLNW